MQVWRCKSSYCSVVASCSGYKDISAGSEDSLLDAVASVGPVRWVGHGTVSDHVRWVGHAMVGPIWWVGHGTTSGQWLLLITVHTYFMLTQGTVIALYAVLQ